MLKIEVLSDEQMNVVDRRQIQQQVDWTSIPPEGIRTRFADVDLTLLPGVFPPKRDTQLLSASVDLSRADSVLDVGTGSGALAIWAARQGDASVIAIDISDAACKNASINVEKLSLKNRIQVRHGDIASTLRQAETFDVIIANLPGRNKKATSTIAAAQWDTDFKAHKALFAHSKSLLRAGGKIFMVKANYPDLLEMVDIATAFKLRTEVIGVSDATPDDPRIYYALALNKLDAAD
ncbi:MAG: tRNA (adenine(22)-N(1))-methyltransferase TrmK [Pseudomonadota bacterium]